MTLFDLLSSIPYSIPRKLSKFFFAHAVYGGNSLRIIRDVSRRETVELR